MCRKVAWIDRRDLGSRNQASPPIDQALLLWVHLPLVTLGLFALNMVVSLCCLQIDLNFHILIELTSSESLLENWLSWSSSAIGIACVGKQMSDFIRLIRVGVWVHIIVPVKGTWKLPIIWCTYLRAVTISKEYLLSHNDSGSNNNRKPSCCSVKWLLSFPVLLQFHHSDYVFV